MGAKAVRPHGHTRDCFHEFDIVCGLAGGDVYAWQGYAERLESLFQQAVDARFETLVQWHYMCCDEHESAEACREYMRANPKKDAVLTAAAEVNIVPGKES